MGGGGWRGEELEKDGLKKGNVSQKNVGNPHSMRLCEFI
jgi:hypothetical protein